MELQELGDSGLRVSRVGLGCNNFGKRVGRKQAITVVEAALDSGIIFFDTADGYGDGDSERFLGDALGGHRDQVIIATKFGSRRAGAKYGVPRGSREHVQRSVTDSLRRLSTDYIDVVYYHMHDGETPISETLGAMNDLIEHGLARAIGCANFNESLVTAAEEAAHSTGNRHFAALQNHYSLLEREAETTLLPLCVTYGIGFVPYWPLEHGQLTGKYRRGEPAPHGSRLANPDETTPATPERHWDRVEALEAFAHEHGHSLLELAIGALASQPGVASVIPGATTAEQVRENAAAAGWHLSTDELKALAQIQ